MNSAEDFDTLFTCKVYNYPSAADYYHEQSCLSVLQHVKIPLLLINAVDDPLVIPDLIPYHLPPMNENIVLITTKHGGHLGWIEGSVFPQLVHWHERVSIELIQALVAYRNCQKK